MHRSKLRLCFVVESGADVRIIEGLAERFDLTVTTRSIRGGNGISHPPAVPVHLIRGPESRVSFAKFAASCLWKNRRDFDAVLVQGYSIAALAVNLVCAVASLPSAMLVCSPIEAYYNCRKLHSEAGKRFRRHELWLLQILARLNAAVSGQYVVLSRHLAETVRRHGFTRSIETIPIYGVDTTFFKPAHESKAKLKGLLGLPQEGSVVFFSSRVAPEKDSEALLGALQILIRRGQNIWILHRSGGYRDFLDSARLFGVEDRVLAADAVHPHIELAALYRASDLCVQASREEGLGFSPLEALACGVPVVATSVGGLVETIIPGKTGWTYPVGDAAALAEQIEKALGDAAESARLTNAGRKMVEAEFDSRYAFQRLESALRERCFRPDPLKNVREIL